MPVTVRVISGDITQEPADALIAAINPVGMWFGGVDAAIQRVSGALFHTQAAAAQPLHDGQVVVASGGPAGEGHFSNVIFVVDDEEKPLRELVASALTQAELSGFKRVTLPAIRARILPVESSVGAVLGEMSIAIAQFVASGPKEVTDITVVIHEDPTAEETLKHLLENAGFKLARTAPNPA